MPVSLWRERSRGFSLIEVLVTLVILAFGLLGVAGLMVSGVSNAASSEARSKASQLAADMADRIRANPAVALSATSEYITTYGESPSTSPTTIAQRDKKEWLESLAAQLPQGDGRITLAVGGGRRKIELEVRWSKCIGTVSDETRTLCTDNAAAQFETLVFDLRL